MFGWLAIARRLSMLGALLPGVGMATTATSLLAEILRFFTTAVGKWLALGLVGVALFIAGDWYRAGIAAEQWRAALAESKLQAAARDEKIRAAMAADAASRVADLRQLASTLQQRVADYEASRSANRGCIATDDDIRRLPDLGQPADAARRQDPGGVRERAGRRPRAGS